jgi:hypothetical protein
MSSTEQAQSARRFGLGALLVLGGLGVLVTVRKHHFVAGAAFVGVGVTVQLLSLFAPAAALRVRAAWMFFAGVLGWINSRILLSAIFFLLLTPVALVRRLFRADPLEMRWNKSVKGSLWRVRTEDPDPSHYEHPS